MGELFKKFVETSTDAKYVPMGSACDLCGKKLSFFSTGFWSTNTQHLTDGVLCPQCARKLQTLALDMGKWMPQEQLSKWKPYADYCWPKLSVAKAKELLALKDATDAGRLAQYGSGAKALLQVDDAFIIEPTTLQVGIARARQIKGKVVVYGRVDQGVFRKGDTARIDRNGVLTEAAILEAYVYDPDVPENNFERTLLAHMGKQQLAKDQVGWLILDYEGEICPGDRIVT